MSALPTHSPDTAALQRLPARAVLVIVGAVILLPVLAVLATWTQWDDRSAAILRAMFETVLPDYAGTSLVLCLMVMVGVAVVGGASQKIRAMRFAAGR